MVIYNITATRALKEKENFGAKVHSSKRETADGHACAGLPFVAPGRPYFSGSRGATFALLLFLIAQGTKTGMIYGAAT
jgi:hypothetical protein